MARVLVTGGFGFIGSATCKDLISRGDEVVVVDNLSFGSRQFVQVHDDNFYKTDILNRTELTEVFERVRPEVVIHLAAIHFIPHCNRYPYESSNINLMGTINVLDAARRCGTVRQLLFASTAAVYPIVDGPIVETQPIGPLDVYGMSKVVGERLCRGFHQETGIPTVICRFFNAFGPNETNPHVIPEILRQIKGGARTLRLGNLDPKRDFIHTTDMSAAMRGLLDRFHEGIDTFNLGRGEEYSVREIVGAFARQLGEDIRIEVDPERVRKVERQHLLADVSKLKRFAQWEPKVTLDQGVRTLLQEGSA